VKIHVTKWIETDLGRKILLDARRKIDFSTEAVFYEAYPYFYERPVNQQFIQNKFARYLRSGGVDIPEEVIFWCIDILAGRISFKV